MKIRILTMFVVMIAAGCSVKYGCPAPDGVTCRPISEVYAGTEGGKIGHTTPGISDRGSEGRCQGPGVWGR
ncbi:MAG: hypothetical protein ACE5HN_00115 [Nitrospiria bacterium]